MEAGREKEKQERIPLLEELNFPWGASLNLSFFSGRKDYE